MLQLMLVVTCHPSAYLLLVRSCATFLVRFVEVHRLSTMARLAISIDNVTSLSGNVVNVNNGKICLDSSRVLGDRKILNVTESHDYMVT